MSVQNYYSKPFRHDGHFIWSSGDDMVMNFPEFMENIPSLDVKDEIVSILNGESEISIYNEKDGFLKYIPENTTIYLFTNKKVIPFLIIRGWGGLTGIGGLNLSEEKAAEIQDTFGQWIVDTLKMKES